MKKERYRVVKCTESGRSFTEGEIYTAYIGNSGAHIVWEDEDGDLCEIPLKIQTAKDDEGEYEILVSAETGDNGAPKFECLDMKPVLRAEWIDITTQMGITIGKCSNCVKKYNESKRPLSLKPLSLHELTPYCSICGAEMRIIL